MDVRIGLIRVSLAFSLIIGAFSHFAFAGSLLISWDSVGDSRVAGYKVKFGTASKNYTSSVDAGPSTSQTLSNLAEGTKYYFVVVAYDAARMEGAPSAEASGVVLATAAVAAVSVAPRSAVITWQTNKVSDQQVVYGTGTTYGMSTVVDPTLSLSHSQTLTDLLPQTTYHFRVKSRDEGGSVAQSADLTFETTNEVLISTLAPSRGTTGTQVVISGNGFGNTSTAGAVTFSGIPASVVSWGQSSITASVPAGATSGVVMVTVNKTPSNGLDFKVNGRLLPPKRFRRRD